MSASKLTRPALDHKESYLEALQEFHDENRYLFIDHTQISENFENFIEKLNDGKRHLHKPYADWVEPVPETTLWLTKNNFFIGTFNIRHRLNWHLEKWGGHMNFVIRPSMRNKGFGKKILQKGMPFACYLGIERGLLTIDPENEAAIKIVEFCGGTLEDETTQTERFPPRRRYWLYCT